MSEFARLVFYTVQYVDTYILKLYNRHEGEGALL